MHNAALRAGNLVASIVEGISPAVKQSNVVLNDVLGALAAGLVFLAIPDAAALGGAAAVLAPIFLKAIQQAPGVAKIIWPIGTVERSVIAIGELQNQLQNVVASLGPRIAEALATVMGKDQGDLSAFLAFAERGDFSGPRSQFANIVNDTSGLLIGFTTFLVSELLILDGWHAVASLDTDPSGLTNGTKTCPFWLFLDGSIRNASFAGYKEECPTNPKFNLYDLQCHGYDEYGQCINSYWWYSQRQETAYTLSKDPYRGYQQPPSKSERDPTTILQTIFANKWSTGQLLLENAGLCAVEALWYRYGSQASLYLFNHVQIPNSSFTDWKAAVESNFQVSVFWQHIALDTFMYVTGMEFVDHEGSTELELGSNIPPFSDFTLTSNGLNNYQCTTQLNVTIFKDWASVWYLHRKFPNDK
ncbi:MAG: hypothetical protein Q9218_006227 [Villophora microphyllina]